MWVHVGPGSQSEEVMWVQGVQVGAEVQGVGVSRGHELTINHHLSNHLLKVFMSTDVLVNKGSNVDTI